MSEVEVTGYKLRAALKKAEIIKDSLYQRFPHSLFAFEGETGEEKEPRKIADQIKKIENKIAKIQTAQSKYNMEVNVLVDEKLISLMEAIKSLGGAGRLEKLWKSVSKGKTGLGRYREDDVELERREEVTRASPTLNRSQALDLAVNAADYAARLRAAIAEGNASILRIELEAGLLG